jgi:hypothetical protein
LASGTVPGGTAFVITGLDHIVVLVNDVKMGEAAYRTLLGREPACGTAATAPTGCCLPSIT